MPWTTTTTRSTGFTMTAAVWNAEVVSNMQYLQRVGYTAFTADVNATATTVGTANQIVTAGAITFEAVPHRIEFQLPRIDVGTASVNVIIRDGSTVLGTLANIPANATVAPAPFAAFYVTPTAASHTYNVAAWVASASTTTFRAGTGGVAGDSTTRIGGFIRITREVV